MTDLSAIRAWFADPHASSGGACGYVGDLLIEIDRLTAERTAETHRHEAALTRLSAVRTALLDETGSAPSITDPPDVWSRAILAAVCGAKMLAEEAEELRRSEAALLYRPEGGADLGFKVVARLWWKPLDNGSIEIEDFTRLSHPEGSPFRRAHYRSGEALSYSFHATPRAAMRAPLT